MIRRARKYSWLERILYRFLLDIHDTFAEQQKIQDNAQQLLIDGLQQQIDNLSFATQQVASSIVTPIITNFLQNADINTSDAVRRGFTGTGEDNACAFWYARDASLTTQFTDSTNATPSPEEITAVPAAGSAPTAWDKDAGVLLWGGNNCVAQPLNKNYARPGVGTSIWVRAILKYSAGATPLDPSYQMRISIWDNTAGQQKILAGADFTLTITPVSGSGTVTRHYILKVNTPAPPPNNFFYSAVSTPASISSTPDPMSGSPGQYSVSWQAFPPEIAVSYELYRSDSIRGLANFYRIDNIVTGLTQAQDIGGLGDLGPITIAGANNMQAQATILDIGDKISLTSWNELWAHILIPPTYNLALTAANSQWIRFDILDATGAFVTIANRMISMDRASASYTDGAWQPSVFDITAPGDFQGNTPDPNGGSPGGTGGGPGKGGGGGILPLEMLGF